MDISKIGFVVFTGWLIPSTIGAMIACPIAFIYGFLEYMFTH
jgi:hypothetical protein